MFAPPEENRFTLVFLRHGQSTGNAAGVPQGQGDYPLSELGIRQAQSLAQLWQRRAVGFDAIISSPLQRAHQTAEIVAAALGSPPLEVDPVWLERDVGVLQGLRPEVAAQSHPRPPFMNPFHPVGNTGESQWAVYIRAAQALESLLSRPLGRYLVVAHGGILNLVLYTALGIAPQANFGGVRFSFGNTAYAWLEYEPNRHRWNLVKLNALSHLPEELRT